MKSNYFSAKAAMKVPKVTPAPSGPSTPAPAPAPAPAPPATPIQPFMHPGSYPYGPIPFGFSPYGYPLTPQGYPPPSHGPPPPHGFYNHAAPGPQSSPTRDHPRLSPPPMGGSLEDFCTKFKINETTQAGLVTLGFEIGDDLSSVKETDWKEAGIPPLTWTRVLKSYKKYKKELNNM